jgi:4-amino-4-deoxy-L-arabinose transferase-like glycosyltransferase
MVAPIPNLIRYADEVFTPVPFHDDRWFYENGWAAIREHPVYLLHALRNFWMGSGLGEMHYWPAGGEAWGFALYSKVFFFIGLLPGLVALLWLFIRKQFLDPAFAPQVALAILLLTVGAGLYLFLSDPRLRVPFDVFFILLGVDGLVRRVTSSGRHTGATASNAT